MKINRTTALSLWHEQYGFSRFAKDFHGNLMCIDGYGDSNYAVWFNGRKIYCGWNIHHILPRSSGGTDQKNNLLCTNYYTNAEAGNRITYWIDDCLYQVKKIQNKQKYGIFKLK